MRPGVTSAVLRWRIGAWLVGASLLLFALDVFILHQGPGFWMLCLFLAQATARPQEAAAAGASVVSAGHGLQYR